MKSIEVKSLLDKAADQVEGGQAILNHLVNRKHFRSYISLRSVHVNSYVKGVNLKRSAIRLFYGNLCGFGFGRMGLKNGTQAFFPFYDMHDVLEAYAGMSTKEDLSPVKRKTLRISHKKYTDPSQASKRSDTDNLVSIVEVSLALKRVRSQLKALGINEETALRIARTVDK